MSSRSSIAGESKFLLRSINGRAFTPSGSVHGEPAGMCLSANDAMGRTFRPVTHKQSMMSWRCGMLTLLTALDFLFGVAKRLFGDHVQRGATSVHEAKRL